MDPTSTKTLAQRAWFVPALLALAVLAVYGQTITFTFVWDDPDLIAHMRASASEGGLGGLLSADYGYLDQAPLGYWRPVSMLFLWANDRLFPTPAGWHAVSVALFLAVVLLFHQAARAFLPGRAAPALAALLFAWWPLHPESVAFVTNRHDLLAGVFFLLSLLAWARARREPSRALWPWLGGAALFLGGLSKESALVLPGVLLAWDGIGLPGEERGRDRSGWWGRNRAWLAAWGAAVAAVVLLRLAVFGAGVGGIPDAPPAGSSPLAQMLGRTAFFLSHLLFPWPVKVDYLPSDAALTGGTALRALLFLLAAAAAGGRAFGRWGWLLLAWVGVTLLPVSGIVPLGGLVVAAHHLFLPAMGWCLFLAFIFHRAAAKGRPRVAAWAAAAACLALGAGSAVEARAWRDEPALFTRMTAESPANLRGHYLLGRRALAAGRYDEALARYAQARRVFPLEVRPPGMEAQIEGGMGSALLGLGRVEEARGTLAAAAQRFPRDPAIQVNLGVALARSGRLPEAKASFAEALRLDPRNAQARENLRRLEGLGGTVR